MDIHSLVSTFSTVLHEYSGMGYFVDLLMKSLFVLMLMILINLFTRKLAASLRHLIWCVGFICLFTLPFFIGLLPKIHVPITATETIVIEHTTAVGIVSFADNMKLGIAAGWKAFLGVYFVLLFTQLFYILLGLFKVYSLSRSSRQVENLRIHQELEDLILEEGLTVPVVLKKSKEVYSPISWGLFSPEVILPEQAEFWDIEIIRNVLIHELSHIQRLDWLTSLIVRISRAIYWFNPLIWFAARKLDEEAEQSCDDAVILNGRCHNEYASNLLEIANHARRGNLGNMIVQAIACSFLGSRVFSILDTSKKRQQTEVVWVVRGILVGCTVIAILGSLRLVPLVNVSSIDPYVNTAFSVIFVPKSEASSFGSYVENLYQEELNSDEQQGGSLIKSSESSTQEYSKTLSFGLSEASGAGAINVNKKSEEARKGNAGYLAQGSEQTGQVSEKKAVNNTEKQSEDVSLLDEYISTTGINDAKEAFDFYVQEYTSDIINNVYSEIEENRLSAQPRTERKPIDQSALIALETNLPDYPKRARQRGIEGYSIVEYEIDNMGKVKDPIIIDSNPGSVFDRPTLRAIQKYTFEPPKINGVVVSVKGQQTKFVYQLKPG